LVRPPRRHGARALRQGIARGDDPRDDRSETAADNTLRAIARNSSAATLPAWEVTTVTNALRLTLKL
jgi:hypothetical protein